MKKLKKTINVVESENKIVNTLCNLIDGTIEGDWGDYKKNERVKYEYDLNDEYYIESFEEEEINIEEVKEFIGEGVCLIYDDEIWYNVYVKDNKIIVDWIWSNI